MNETDKRVEIGEKLKSIEILKQKLDKKQFEEYREKVLREINELKREG